MGVRFISLIVDELARIWIEKIKIYFGIFLVDGDWAFVAKTSLLFEASLLRVLLSRRTELQSQDHGPIRPERGQRVSA